METVTEGDKGDDALQGALVSVEPGTGRVLAYYGGANGTGSTTRGAWRAAGRHPAHHRAARLVDQGVRARHGPEQGISLSTTLDGNSPKPFAGRQAAGHRQLRRRRTDYGRVDLVEATEDSINTAYYELAAGVGPDKVAELAHAAGVTDRVSWPRRAPVTRTPGIALGRTRCA